MDTNQNKTMNDWILRATGRGPENIQPSETSEDLAGNDEPVSMGSADGAAGTTNSKPKLSPNQRMNKALVDAWKRRTGRIR